MCCTELKAIHDLAGLMLMLSSLMKTLYYVLVVVSSEVCVCVCVRVHLVPLVSGGGSGGQAGRAGGQPEGADRPQVPLTGCHSRAQGQAQGN